MSLIDIPDFAFSPWQAWRHRDRLADEWDVPPEFGLLGLYLLAVEGASVAVNSITKVANLPQEVVYIGMSTHVDRRLERSHDAVRAYKEAYSDPRCLRLRFAKWESDWSNSALHQAPGIERLAALKTYERALLFCYARQFGRLPALNNV